MWSIHHTSLCVSCYYRNDNVFEQVEQYKPELPCSQHYGESCFYVK